MPLYSRRGFLSGAASIVAGVAGSALLAACGSAAAPTAAPQAPAASGTGGTPAASSSGSAATVSKIAYWNDYGGANGKPMDELLAKFTKENGVQIEQVRAAEADLISKMRLAAQAGTSPDSVMLLTFAVPATAHDNLIEAMDDKELAQRGFKADDYAQTPWESGLYKGKRYALALDFVQIVLYLNTSMFKAASLTDSNGKPQVPKNMDDVVNMAKKLTTSDGAYGLNVGPAGGTWWFQNLLFQNGGDFFNTDMSKSALDDPSAVEVADFWGKVFTSLKISPPGAFDTLKGFIAGKLAMSLDGSWSNPGFQDAKIDYTVASVPTFFKQAKAWGIDHSFTLPVQKTKDDARRETTWKFIRWMTDHAEEWTLTGGVMAALKSVQTSQKVLADPLLKVCAEQTPNLQFSQPTSKWAGAENKSTPILESIYNGATPAKDGMQQLAQQIDALTE